MRLSVVIANVRPQAFETAEPNEKSADALLTAELTEDIFDIMGGVKRMRAAGEKHLPKFTDETKDEYSNRLKLTKMTNVFSDIIDGLSAKPFEEEAKLTKDEKNEVPQELNDLMEDIDGRGGNLTSVAAGIFAEGIAYGIDWILIDYPDTSNKEIRTMADQKAAGNRPFWSRISASNVLEVKAKMIGGREHITYFRFMQSEKIWEYEKIGNSITWNTYKQDEKSKKWVLEKAGILTIDVIPVTYFATGKRLGKGFVFKPPLTEAANTQIELYLEESALKFVKNLAGYPMLTGNGVNPPKDAEGKPDTLRIGPARVLYAPPDGNGGSGSWAFIEPSAQTLAFLASDIKSTKEDLRELGKQPLTATGNVTVIANVVAAGKAKTAVGAWALLLKNSLENAILITQKWMNIPEEIYSATVFVYTEFDNFLDSEKDLDALGKARDRADISQLTYWDELARRRVLSGDFDAETEKERLLNETPNEN